ncbi:MAG: DNA topoisomerase III [Polyangiaceae bacterium]
MRVFLAEKPSLARAIADALPAPQKRVGSHIECGGGNVVAWAAGHILEMAPPDRYRAEYGQWRLEHLPIVPGEWKLEVSEATLLRSIARLLKKAARVVHAGDPDREGQLLIDEVLAFLGYRGPVDRLLVRDLSPDAIRAALGALEPNTKYRPLYESALARQRADWLFGINMTRLYTILGRQAGYAGVLSVGRVQTPLLGLIVARDRAIAEFRPVPYYVVEAEVRAGGGESFRALWVPPASVELDKDGRLLRREVADAARLRLAGQTGTVAACTDDRRSEAPPLPYSLADLQMDASRRLGLSAQAVLDACQALYERHRLLTYPRSDCAHLPEAHHPQAASVLAAVAKLLPALGPFLSAADVTRRSKAWNDKKVTAHHAIVPTSSAPGSELTTAERAIYELVARRYAAQFFGPREYLETKVELDVAGDRLVTSGRRPTAAGWKVLYEGARDEADDADATLSEKSDDDARESLGPLPELAVGARVTVERMAVEDKQTRPPKPFTDASLIAAMCGVAKFVSDPKVKKILTETDGIGTPATRAGIIETIFERRYVERVKQTIVSNETGRALVRSLPEVATTPDMTAVWEVAIRTIAEGRATSGAFLECVRAQLEGLVAEGRALGRIAVPEGPAPSAHPPNLPSRTNARPRCKPRRRKKDRT